MKKLQSTHGVEIPSVGFGTYHLTDSSAQTLVATAIELGYRHIDTAEKYENETGVGEAIRASIERGLVGRDDLFVTTKLWPSNLQKDDAPHTAESTVESLDASLLRLQLDYVDLYLIHAPLHPEQRLAQWRGLLEIQRQGKARAIGVSNFGQKHLEEIKEAGLPLPAANQLELHPWSQKPDLISYQIEHGIAAIAYSSLVPLSTWRALAGQGSGKTEQMRQDGLESPFAAMAAKYGVSEAQVLLRWGVQKGFAVIPKSANEDRIRKNIDLFSFEIDRDDMAAIAEMDRGKAVAWSIGDPTAFV